MTPGCLRVADCACLIVGFIDTMRAKGYAVESLGPRGDLAARLSLILQTLRRGGLQVAECTVAP